MDNNNRGEKVDNNNKGESSGDEGNSQGALKKQGPTLKEKVDKMQRRWRWCPRIWNSSHSCTLSINGAISRGDRINTGNGEGAMDGEGGGGDGQGVMGMKYMYN